MPVTPRGLRLRFAYHEKQKIYSLRGLNFAFSLVLKITTNLISYHAITPFPPTSCQF